MASVHTNGSNKRSKAKRSKSNNNEDRVGPPSAKHWDEMVTYTSFVVKDDSGNDVRFEKEQVVLILPHGFDPQKRHDIVTYWVAKIKDIRAETFIDGSNSVWVKVQWFYSGKDVSDVIKSFNPKSVGKHERIFSDHHDYVQPEAFEAKIPMYKFNEQDHEQGYIPEDSFYRRYTFEYRARNLQPKPGLITCICQDPYNPNDADPLSLMHFCPRPSCRKGYHHRCLKAKKSKESSSASATSKVVLTTKMPKFPTVPERTEQDTVRVQRSARKQAVPPKKLPPALTMRKKHQHQQDSDEEAQVIKVVFPTSPAMEVVEDSLSPLGTPQESISLTERSLRLLACSPDTNETLDLEALIPDNSDNMDIPGQGASEESDTESDRPRKKSSNRSRRNATQRKKAKKSRTLLHTEKVSLATVLSTIPPDLLRVATQPLVRGAAFRAGGVAGNIGMVTRARRLIYTALQMGGGPGSIPDDWEDVVFGEDRLLVGCGVKNAMVRVDVWDDKTIIPAFVCLDCKSAI